MSRTREVGSGDDAGRVRAYDAPSPDYENPMNWVTQRENLDAEITQLTSDITKLETRKAAREAERAKVQSDIEWAIVQDPALLDAEYSEL